MPNRKASDERAGVRIARIGAICQLDGARLEDFETELHTHDFGNAKKYCTRIGKRRNLHGFE